LASALNISAFNVGITLGSTIGGQAVAHSQLVNTPWLGVAMLVLGILLIGILIKMENNVKVEDLDLENC
jgi:Arabinose efflux permease